MDDIVNKITESVTSPSSSVPIVGAVGTLNIFASLPEIINILTIVYLFLLCLHKGYVVYQEWKQKKIIKDDE